MFGASLSGSKEETHRACRLEVLLQPPRGSPMHVSNRGLNLDRDCPPSSWAPRPASAAEQRQVQEVRDMQAAIKRHLGARGTADISPADMQQVLLQTHGDRWAEGVKVYQTALNALDQGVPENGYR